MSTPVRNAPVRNAMSVDVEDWFQVQAFANLIDRDEWDRLAPRVGTNTRHVLDAFGRAGVKATFFTLGWVAERDPALIRRIVADGHELASHGFGHQLVNAIGRDAFRADIRRAKQILEDASGTRVIGYRAPTFSVGVRTTPWAHAVLAEEGYAYSSSIFPIRHDLYGESDAPRGPHRPFADGVIELPMTTVRALGRNLPCSGGGWFRLLPYGLFRAGLRRVNAVDPWPGTFYFHPWEVDPGQPRVAGTAWRSRFRHYARLSSMARRIDRLLRDFAWGRMDDVHAAAIGNQQGAH
ncbi:XrtA system polysaccharide deacetylase [Humitalea sp. 24SJ18S-53]|uniref:XrtA system polysaccharide deacetylase n=1 Tax=Humitalea sp. 24SJ18S-53 TaxID=3422307 RepID=UPI003D66A6DE